MKTKGGQRHSGFSMKNNGLSTGEAEAWQKPGSGVDFK
jgi:hypothetical protein